jgi:hypothetical protein
LATYGYLLIRVITRSDADERSDTGDRAGSGACAVLARRRAPYHEFMTSELLLADTPVAARARVLGSD